jgi:ChrR Cupin-like domain
VSPAADNPELNHSELPYLYVLQALPAGELPAAEKHITQCAECRREIEMLRPVLDALPAWPTDVLRPPVSLWDRLERRVAKEAGAEPIALATRYEEPAWKEVAPGISCKLLATDDETDRVSMLVRLTPGTDYPAHSHAGVEELHLLDGELWIDDRKLYPGDYNRGEPGTADKRVWSETGCTCVLVTSTRDVLK